MRVSASAAAGGQSSEVPATPSKTFSAPAVALRLPMVDAVRFICVLWVIWIHIIDRSGLREGTGFARFRLPVFIILSIFFVFSTQEKRPSRTFLQYTIERVRQLYIPFLFWAGLYYVLFGGIEVFIKHGVWPALSNGIWLHGQAVHLWFIPFILVADICTFPIARKFLAAPRYATAYVATGLLAGFLLLAFAGPYFTDTLIDFSYPQRLKDLLWRMMTLGPCIPVGIAVYFVNQWAGQRGGNTARQLAAAGLGLFFTCTLLTILWMPHPFFEAAAGLGVVLLALCPTENPFCKWLANWGRYSFGIYLTHLVFVLLLQLLQTEYLHLPPSIGYDLFTLCASAVLSLVTAIQLSRPHLTRWLILPSASQPSVRPAA